MNYTINVLKYNLGKNKDKIKYMRVLREMIEKYGYSKYVKKTKYFCHLDWWHAKDAYIVFRIIAKNMSERQECNKYVWQKRLYSSSLEKLSNTQV